MDIETQKMLVEINSSFYRTYADSFSATRASAWQGWRQCADVLKNLGRPKFCVLDVGCGNMRFERFLADELPDCQISFYTADNCEALIPTELPADAIYHTQTDVISALLNHERALDGLATCAVACSFGVAHHIPGRDNRRAFLQELVEHTNPGGLVIVSLWRFLDNERLAQKARKALESACQDETLPLSLRMQLPDLFNQNDCLLGWQNTAHAWRYCHSFDTKEIGELVGEISQQTTCIARFCADGASNNANEYLILQRNAE